MEDNIITIHQAYYGEVNKSHGCLKQTLPDLEISSSLLSFTDRPGSIPPGIELKPYLSGGRLGQYYVLTKTYPDDSAKRSGMVFTHVLILHVGDLQRINNISEILTIFGTNIPTNINELNPIKFPIPPNKINTPEKQIPKYLEEVILQLITGKIPVLFSGNINSFEFVLNHMWKGVYPVLRDKLKFSASFTPVDLDVREDLIIVSIQKDFKLKWSGYNIISDSQQSQVDIISNAVGMFLGDKEEAPFNSFLLSIGASISDFKQYGQYYQLYETSKSLNDSVNANEVRQSIRLLSILLPSPLKGKDIKQEFVNKLTELLQSGKDANITSLRNLNVSAFQNGETLFSNIISNFLKEKLENVLYTEFSSDLEIAVGTDSNTPKWWRNSFVETVNNSIKHFPKPAVRNLWSEVSNSTTTVANLFKILPKDHVTEERLRKSIPQSLNNDVFKLLLEYSKERKWFLLHAELLLTRDIPVKALSQQLKVEISEPLTTSLGVNYICSKVDDESLLKLTLEPGDNKLIELFANRILKDEHLLSTIDVSKSIWISIWEKVLEKTKNINYGIEERASNIVNEVFELIRSEKQVPDIITECIANSNFADLSGYKERKLIWDRIALKYKEKFLSATGIGLLNKIGNAALTKTEIEPEFMDAFRNGGFVDNYLKTAAIENGIQIFHALSLPDELFARYLNRFNIPIEEKLGIVLGRFIIDVQFRLSAEVVFRKSKYIAGYKVAYEECKSLVPDNVKGLQLPKVVILTAINEEYLAVQSHLQQIESIEFSDTRYEKGVFQINGVPIAEVIIRECGQRSVNTNSDTERAINSFSPKCILFIGIAGSRKPNDFALGDVIFPDKVYSYEGGKSGLKFFGSRPDSAKPSYMLEEIAKEERRKSDWKSLITGSYNENLKANLGSLASGEKILEHYDSAIGKILTEHFNDTAVVEMEGFGFLETARRRGRRDLEYGVIRAISDVLERGNGNGSLSATDRRPANAKILASNNAAAFGYWLIYKLFENRRYS